MKTHNHNSRHNSSHNFNNKPKLPVDFFLLRLELRSFFRKPSTYFMWGAVSFFVAFSLFQTLNQYFALLKAGQVSGLLGSLVFPFASSAALWMIPTIGFLSMNEFSRDFETQEFDWAVLSVNSYSKKSWWNHVLNRFLTLVLKSVILLSTVVFGLLFFLFEVQGIDWVLACSILAFFLELCFLGSIGLWCSSLTQSNILAGLLFVLATLSFRVSLLLSEQISNLALADIVRTFSSSVHFVGISSGHFRLSDLVYYMVGTLFFLFATTRNLSLRQVSR